MSCSERERVLFRSDAAQPYDDRGQVSFMLQPGDYLIVNQRRFLHGPEALHSGQETVPAADRRLLLQLFQRAPAGARSAA
ncbi:hypothetical protein ACFYWN_46405 [Streptomyces sp. NPDC002917]|uniref:hypothetical protein n=1 Tax=Streptomyces sp. NPDC002917 TaxID=3364671 RepID=UPI00367BB7A3